jgi:hypothetical protein
MQKEITCLLIVLIAGLTSVSCFKAQKSNYERSKAILEFVCNNNEAWSMNGVITYTVTMDTTRKDTVNAKSLSEKEVDEIDSICRSNKTSLEKLTKIAAITKIYSQITCEYNQQIPIREVVVKFGEPDKKWKGSYESNPYSKSNVVWYCYGSLMLGVYQRRDTEEEYISVVRIDGPTWQKEISEKDN